jgi:hypothetical protein
LPWLVSTAVKLFKVCREQQTTKCCFLTCIVLSAALESRRLHNAGRETTGRCHCTRGSKRPQPARKRSSRSCC